jgi:D-tyrosyl-tRNA(Tyr) deacylase
MRLVIQRVSDAWCDVDGEETGRIGGPGLLVFVGVAQGDTVGQVDWLVNKVLNMRIFPDAEGRMNLSLIDTGYGMLAISQFTLLADCGKGRRPNFMAAAPPDEGERLYNEFVARARTHAPVATGRFGAMMHITAHNDGPVTIVVDSK